MPVACVALALGVGQPSPCRPASGSGRERRTYRISSSLYRKEIVMRALWHRIVGPLLVAAIVLSAGYQIQAATVGTAMSGGASLAACPLGTHWDNTAQSCI
jgi:hypothetical protein